MSRRKLFERPRDLKEPKVSIRIYCEGEKTEPYYFQAIRDEIKSTSIHIVAEGFGEATTTLVDRIIAAKEQRSRTDEQTEWWAVFDRDSHFGFNKAVRDAEANQINVAYSNESFELWLLLHFNLCGSALTRNILKSKLKECMGGHYEKGDKTTYSRLKNREAAAIRNARSLERTHTSEGSLLPEDRNPSTTVYKLVERLRSIT